MEDQAGSNTFCVVCYWGSDLFTHMVPVFFQEPVCGDALEQTSPSSTLSRPSCSDGRNASNCLRDCSLWGCSSSDYSVCGSSAECTDGCCEAWRADFRSQLGRYR